MNGDAAEKVTDPDESILGVGNALLLPRDISSIALVVRSLDCEVSSLIGLPELGLCVDYLNPEAPLSWMCVRWAGVGRYEVAADLSGGLRSSALDLFRNKIHL